MNAKPQSVSAYDAQRVWRDFPILARQVHGSRDEGLVAGDVHRVEAEVMVEAAGHARGKGRAGPRQHRAPGP